MECQSMRGESRVGRVIPAFSTRLASPTTEFSIARLISRSISARVIVVTFVEARESVNTLDRCDRTMTFASHCARRCRVRMLGASTIGSSRASK